MRIFVDMDGVLVDWNRGFKDVCPENIGPREYEAKYGKNSYWEIINKYGINWWVDLNWMPDGKKLWNFIKDEAIILSAPSRAYSIEGKVIWLKNHLGLTDKPCFDLNNWDGKTRIILGKHKYLVCESKHDILIDDTQDKLNDWMAVGGTAILHKSADNTIKCLIKELKVLI